MTDILAQEPYTAAESPDHTAHFVDAVAGAFSPAGTLSQCIAGFVPRAPQTDMALAVAQALDARSSLMVEAGTGVGKSYAYLVPALLHGGKVLISTATKTLQDQLYLKDLPAVRAALGVTVDAALLKGRSNYLCHQRLRRAADEARFASRDAATHLRRVLWLAQASPTGDRADLPDVPDDSSVWPWVTSTKDNCLGADCPDFGECFVVKARRRAMAADVVVINHHLFFADLMLRDTGMGEILPSADALIFDEAHQLPDIGLNFAGVQASTQQWIELARDVQAAGLALARGAADWAAHAAQLHRAVREARLAAGDRTGRFAWDLMPAAATHEALQQLAAPLPLLQQPLAALAEAAPDFIRLAARCTELAGICKQLLEGTAMPLRMVEVTPHAARWRAAPLNLAETFAPFVRDTHAAFVFTSATLASGQDFSYTASGLGFAPESAVALASPFDFATQALLYVPQAARFPLPREAGFEDRVVSDALQLVRANAGGALLLCTSLKSMRTLGERLASELRNDGVDVIVQGEVSRREALTRMREQPGGNAEPRRKLLVGSQSFWEGLDLPGDLLTLVMIDKLPFAPPDDPIAKARSDAAEREGQSGFQAVSLPQAAIALKQGAGRLIRTVSDRGVLVVFDKRLTATGWGRSLVRALPPFKQTAVLQDALAFLQQSNAALGSCAE
jgi:ATP-dependent DNA helicase DinG